MQKSTYYREWTDGDGVRRVETTVFPSDGDWAATYDARGWKTVPPESADEDEGDEEPGDGLDEMKMSELRPIAVELHISVPVGTKKTDLVENIRTARERELAAAATRN